MGLAPPVMRTTLPRSGCFMGVGTLCKPTAAVVSSILAPNMERLWAPWRMDYIKNHKDSTPCFLCAAVKSKRDEANLIVVRGQSCLAILNRYPYANGHLMIAPNAHRGSLGDL